MYPYKTHLDIAPETAEVRQALPPANRRRSDGFCPVNSWHRQFSRAAALRISASSVLSGFDSLLVLSALVSAALRLRVKF
jgi:hypothetical protein